MIEIATPRRYKSQAQKGLSKQFMYTKTNTYEGIMVTDEDLNYQLDGDYLFKYQKSAWDRIQELISYRAVIADLEFIELLKVEGKNIAQIPNHGKIYIYCVAPELHSGKGVINYHDDYPGVRICTSYNDAITHIESIFTDELVYVLGMNSMEEMKYLINKIELCMLQGVDKPITPTLNEVFPVDEYVRFLGFKLNQRTLDKISVIKVSEEYKGVIDTISDKEHFSDYIKFMGKNREKISDIKKSVSEDYHLIQLHRSPNNNVYEFRKKMFTKHFSELGSISTLRFIRIKSSDLIAIYSCHNGSDSVIKIIDVNDYDTDVVSLGTKSKDVPHSIAITRTQISNYSNELNLDAQELTNKLLDTRLQIQGR